MRGTTLNAYKLPEFIVELIRSKQSCWKNNLQCYSKPKKTVNIPKRQRRMSVPMVLRNSRFNTLNGRNTKEQNLTVSVDEMNVF